MKVVIFGLTVSSSWGNGHATLWRGLLKAFARRGHNVVFYERDVPYYAANRDLDELPGSTLRLYPDFQQIREETRAELKDADLAIATSYCPDAVEAAAEILDSSAKLKAFYDLDTPVTLDQVNSGMPVPYLPSNGLADFDLVFSYTGGRALEELSDRLGARRGFPLYGSVDPDAHFPAAPRPDYACNLSYLGTYSEDRQETLDRLFLEPARRRPNQRFIIGGAQYPENFPWTSNLWFVRHLPPSLHPVFFSSSRATLNVTRRAMKEYGYCPSGRLFEAAACGTPIFSDDWVGLNTFFNPGEELLVVKTADDVVRSLDLPDEELEWIAERARQRVLREHTADQRVQEVERICRALLAIRAENESQNLRRRKAS